MCHFRCETAKLLQFAPAKVQINLTRKMATKQVILLLFVVAAGWTGAVNPGLRLRLTDKGLSYGKSSTHRGQEYLFKFY